MRRLTEQNIRDVAVGAAILGTGGGGDPHLGMLAAIQATRLQGEIELVGLEEVPDDAFIVPVAMMGAPTVATEKLSSLDGLAAAVDAVAAHFGRSATHIMPVEVGGINSLYPLAAAAQAGLPLIDADLMGRAFPALEMVIPTLVGISSSPVAIADERGNTVIVSSTDNASSERLGRVIVTEMGATALIAVYAMTGAQARSATVRGSLTTAQELGETHRFARANGGEPVAAIVASLGAKLLLTGKVTDLDKRTTGGFTHLDAHVEGLDGDRGASLRMRSQNEHLLAERDGEVVASTPDLLIILDSVTGVPVTTEALRYGLRVSVLAAPGDPRFTTPEGLAIVGPRAFGYDIEYVGIGG